MAQPLPPGATQGVMGKRAASPAPASFQKATARKNMTGQR